MAGESSGSWLDLNAGFIRRVLITTAWLGAVSFLCLSVYAGAGKGAAWACGVALGIADLFLLDMLLRELIGRRRKGSLAAYGLLKFVGVYAGGAVALFTFRLPLWFFLGGFSLFLGVVLLKVLGRLLLSTSSFSQRRTGPGGPLLRNSPSTGREPRR